MKTKILSLMIAILVPAVSSAKIEDFNAMIDESAQAQMQLRNELKEQLAESRKAQEETQNKVLEIADERGHSINTPTKKSMLTFEKEMGYYRAKDSKKMKRFANELKASDLAF